MTPLSGPGNGPAGRTALLTSGPVVVGVDGSAGSRAALRWAADEAGLRRRTLLVAHASTDAGNRPAAELLLHSCTAEASARQPAIPVTSLVSQSGAADTLIELSLDADLIVLGPGTRSAMLGSVSRQVNAHAHCPVAAMPAATAVLATGDELRRRPIVVAMAGRPTDSFVLDFALAEAQLRAAGLLAIRVVPPADVDTSLRQGHSELEFELALFRPRYPQVALTARCLPGEPAQALLDAAASAQLLVLGGRHSDQLWAGRLGPVPTELLARTPCPVIVVGQSARHQTPLESFGGARR
ncbi:MAG: universal stress protein [Jatrophihabitans sp.]